MQKTAYEMRISDWSSDVCSSDLLLRWTVLDKFFLLALAGWALLVFPEVFSGMDYAEPLAVLVPDSRDALNRVMWDLAAPMGALLLLYAADRTGRMSSTTALADLTDRQSVV